MERGAVLSLSSRKGLLLLLVFLLAGPLISLGEAPSPPKIVTISFPSILPLGAEGWGRVEFQDFDGDFTAMGLAVVDGRLTNRTLELALTGRQEGSFAFSVPCTAFSQELTLQMRLYDRAGNASSPKTFSFTCGAPTSYNYDEEQADIRPISTRLVLNFFILTDGTTLLAEGASFPPGSPLGEPDPLVRRAIGEALLPGLEGIWDQCGLGFERGSVKVVDPERLRLGLDGSTLAGQLFTLQGGERVILAEGRTIGLLGRALQLLEPLVREEGGALRGGLNVFLVGRKILAQWREVEGFSATAGPSYALVRWGAISFDGAGGTFHRPKQVTATLAHELGHNLGLKHPDQDGLPGTEEDQFNLMWGSGVTPNPRAGLLPAQCRVAVANLTEMMRPEGPSSLSPGPTSGPRAEFERPQEGATLSGEVELRVRGEGFQELERAGLARFELSRDGGRFEPIGVDGDGSDGFSTIWETGSVASGTYLLRAVLVDGRGRSASAELRVKVAN